MLVEGNGVDPHSGHAMVQAPDGPWTANDLDGYASSCEAVPIVESSITPLSAGSLNNRAEIVKIRESFLARLAPAMRSVGVTVMEPRYTAIAIPLAWVDEYIINGYAADTSSIYLPSDDGVIYIRGGPRDTLVAVVPRDALIETIAFLRGVDPDQVALEGRPHRLPPTRAILMRSKLLEILNAGAIRGSPGTPRGRHEGFAEGIVDLCADAYLHALPVQNHTRGGDQSLAKIVRRAEEWFLDAAGDKVSLADLCRAAGVAKNTLYRAFAQICDAPPHAYFRKRQLLRARTLLVAAGASDRGAVKRAAIDVGMTELGRFSVEYRRFFGESPSTTLRSRRIRPFVPDGQ